MKNLLKRTACFLLSLLLAAGTMIVNPAPARADAADDLIYLIEPTEPQTGIAHEAKVHPFTTKTTGPLYVGVWFAKPTTFTYELTTSSGSIIDSDTIQETDDGWEEIVSDDNTALYVHGPMYKSSSVGTYNLKITPNEDTVYLISIAQGSSPASLSHSNVSVTEGFTQTLKVTNTSGTVTWKSSNTKIATVSKKGVVTAKKPGSCTVTATTADKQTLKCKVKVVKNVYKDVKATNADAESGKATAYVYQASLDSSGNLACKIRVINNTSRTITKIADSTITVKNEKNKTMYSYKIKSKAITVSPYKYKDCTVKIPKSKVKKCDLVKGTVNMTGSYYSR